MWVRIKKDVHIPGWGWLLKGRIFPVIKKNPRYVYIKLATDVTCRLARKQYCEEAKGWLFDEPEDD